MIFATVGSMFPFDRFAAAVDEWAARAGVADVLIQIGSGEYEPSHARWERMMRPADFKTAVETCSVVVAHLGMGSIITAMQAQKPLILLPRLRELGEHTSDHQMHATDWLRDRPGLWIANDVPDLHRLLDEFQAGTLQGNLTSVSPFASDELLTKVRSFVFDGVPASQ